MKVNKCEIPKQSIIEHNLNRNDYWDAFSVEIPLPASEILEQMPVAFFKAFPSWFTGLMYLRDFLASIIGLKTAVGIDVGQQMKDFKGEVGQSIALFKVLDRSETEIMTGETDSHLDFRLSYFAIPKGSDRTELNMTTTVEFNNWVGRLYFVPVKPIHRLIVPIILKRMAKVILEKNNAKVKSEQ